MSQTTAAVLTLYRRCASSRDHLLKEWAEGLIKKGDLFYEFVETWQRYRRDELSDKKWRVDQRPTGRKFRYAGNISQEMSLDTPEVKARYRDGVLVFSSDDFSYICLTRA